MGVYSKGASTLNTVMEACDPIQFVIENHQQNMKMFDAIIETDFAKAYNEAGIAVLEESQIQAINEKAIGSIIEWIMKKIDQFITMCWNAAKELANKILQLVKADKKLSDKFGDVVSKATSCTFKGDVVDKESFNKFRKVVEDNIGIIRDMLAFDNIDDINAEETKTGIENLDKFIKEFKMDTVLNKEDKTILEKIKGSDLAATVKGGYNEYKIDKDTKDITDAAKKLKGEIKTKIKNESNEEEVAKLEAARKNISSITNIAARLIKLEISVAKQCISITRGNFVKVATELTKSSSISGDIKAKKAAKSEPVEKVKGEVVENEATAFELKEMIMEMVSDEFVDSIFA